MRTKSYGNSYLDSYANWQPLTIELLGKLRKLIKWGNGSTNIWLTGCKKKMSPRNQSRAQRVIGKEIALPIWLPETKLSWKKKYQMTGVGSLYPENHQRGFINSYKSVQYCSEFFSIIFCAISCWIIQKPLHRGLKSSVDFLEIDFQSRFCVLIHTSWGVKWQKSIYKILRQLEAVCGCYEFFKGASYTVVNWAALGRTWTHYMSWNAPLQKLVKIVWSRDKLNFTGPSWNLISSLKVVL
jgi:hypothetical protein